MKKLKSIVTVLLCTIFFTTHAGILTDEDTGPTPTPVIKLKGPFKVVRTACSTKGGPAELSLGGSGAKAAYSPTKTNYKMDCADGGRLITCQVINCDGKTEYIVIHEPTSN